MSQLKELEFQQNRKLINLYRKNRDKELQKRIDQIFSETDNTTLRIKLMEKLDEEHENKQEKGTKDSKKEIEKKKLQKEKKKEVLDNSNFKAETFQESFSKIKSLFQKVINILGLNKEIKDFSYSSNQLLNYSFVQCDLSEKIIDSFNEVPEKKVLDILKIFDYLQKEGWLFWDPHTYNYIYNLNLFLDEFFKMKFYLTNPDKNKSYIELSKKMQEHYAVFLKEEVNINTIKNEIIKVMLNNNELMQKQHLIHEIFDYVLRLEKKHIKLTSVIQAMYICEKKEMIHWKDILKKLNPQPIEPKVYINKNNSVLKKISLRVLKIKNLVKEKEEEKRYIQRIRNDYFKINNGVVCIDFIEEIVLEYINSYYMQEINIDEMKELYLSNPMHLLNIILNYLISNYCDILIESSVKLLNPVDKKVTKAKILESTIFDSHFEKIKIIQKSIDNHFKESLDMKYNFDDLINRKITEDGKYLTILNTSKESSKIFLDMAEKIRELLNNHFSYLSNLAINKNSNSDSYYESIKKITNKPKLIPYYNFLITSTGNLFQQTIEYSFEYLAKLLYNCCYLYKEANVSKMFDERYLLDMDKNLQDLYEEYERLTQKKYIND